MYHLESQQDPSSLKKVCFHRLLLGETDLLSGNRTLCDFLNSIIKLNNDEYSFFNPLVTTLLTQVTKKCILLSEICAIFKGFSVQHDGK